MVSCRRELALEGALAEEEGEPTTSSMLRPGKAVERTMAPVDAVLDMLTDAWGRLERI